MSAEDHAHPNHGIGTPPMTLVPQQDNECCLTITSAQKQPEEQCLGGFYRSKNISMNTRTWSFPSEHCTVGMINVPHFILLVAAAWIYGLHMNSWRLFNIHFLCHTLPNDSEWKESMPPCAKSIFPAMKKTFIRLANTNLYYIDSPGNDVISVVSEASCITVISK